MRRLVRNVHLTLALAIGLFAAVSGLTGTMLVYQAELDRTLNPDLLTVEPRPAPLQLDAALAAVRARHPDAPIRFVRLPRAADEAYEVWIEREERLRVYLDPYDARILGARGEHAGLLGFIDNLHEHLLAGTVGSTVAGVVALMMLALLATGLVLFWPGLRKLAAAFRIRWSGPRLRAVYDLHRVGGIATLPLLGLSALTGAALVFHNVSAALLVSVLGGEALRAAPRLERPAEDALPASVLVERARALLPGAVPSWIYLPASAAAPFIVRLRFDDNPHPNGTSYIVLDPASGGSLAVHSERAAGAGQQAADLRYPLHTGAAFGSAGRVATAAIGLAPTILLITGLWFWTGRRAAARRRR